MELIKNIILALQKVHARIAVEGEALRIDAEKGVLDEELKGLIRTHKRELIEYIKKIRENGSSVIPVAEWSASYPLSSAQRRL